MHQTIILVTDEADNKIYVKLVDKKGLIKDNVTITPVGEELVMH